MTRTDVARVKPEGIGCVAIVRPEGQPVDRSSTAVPGVRPRRNSQGRTGRRFCFKGGSTVRLPYLQVTQETWGKARALSGMLGIDRHRAISMILDLWAWAIDLGPEDQAPTGDIPVPPDMAAGAIAGVVEWSGDPARLVIAMSSVGLLKTCDFGALRVAGMDRYKRTWEKNKRRKNGGSVPETGAHGAGNRTHDPHIGAGNSKTGTLPAPQTQTQTQIEALNNEAKPEKAQKRPTSVQAEFVAWAKGERDASFPQAPPDAPISWPNHGAKLTEMLKSYGMRLSQEAYRLFLKDDYARERDPACPMPLFVSQWPKFISAAQKSISPNRAVDPPPLWTEPPNRPPVLTKDALRNMMGKAANDE